jgi:hypothetical protein
MPRYRTRGENEIEMTFWQWLGGLWEIRETIHNLVNDTSVDGRSGEDKRLEFQEKITDKTGCSRRQANALNEIYCSPIRNNDLKEFFKSQDKESET